MSEAVLCESRLAAAVMQIQEADPSFALNMDVLSSAIEICEDAKLRLHSLTPGERETAREAFALCGEVFEMVAEKLDHLKEAE